MILKNTFSQLTALLLSALLTSVAVAESSQSHLATVTSRQLIDFPDPMHVQLAHKDASELSPELIEAANSELAERGVFVTDSGSFLLFIRRTDKAPAKVNKPPVSLTAEGGSRSLNRAEVALELDASGKKGYPNASAQTRGFEMRLEGPAGATWWQARVVTRKAAGSKNLTDTRLLREALKEFGRTTARKVY